MLLSTIWRLGFIKSVQIKVAIDVTFADLVAQRFGGN